MNRWKTFNSFVSHRHVFNLFLAFHLIAMRGPKEGVTFRLHPGWDRGQEEGVPLTHIVKSYDVEV